MSIIDESFLDTFVVAGYYSVIFVPIISLILATVLYYYKPIHRLEVGIIALTFGVLGVTIYSFSLWIAIVKGRGAWLLIILLSVWILTLYMGVKSLKERYVKPIIKQP